MRRLVAILVVAGVAGAVAAPAQARPEFGVVSQDVLSARDFERMGKGGVETLRFVLHRRAVETGPGAYDWSKLDTVVAGAAGERIDLLPIVYGSPPWVHRVEAHPPIDTRAARAGWKRFLTALIDRYGPGGELWAGRPGKPNPIRRWQLWNEGNFEFYWHPRPSAAEYGRLVQVSADAIRRADPGAEIVLGGVASVASGVKWWRYMEELYEARGIKRDFDAVALHPYSPGIGFLGRQIELMREIMRAAGDPRTPLAITEIGWASGGDPRAPLVVGEAGQARLLRRSFAYLERHAREWRISDVQWYAWQDSLAVESFCSFCQHAGLFTRAGKPKPAWRAFQRAVR
jgi:hypothetical protein